MAMEQRARFHAHQTPGIKAGQKVYAKFIEEMKKKTKEMRKNPSRVYYHEAPLLMTSKYCEKEVMLVLDYQTAYDMGKIIPRWKSETWEDSDLESPHYWGTTPN